MGEAAMPIRRRIELSVNEARLRFQQLVRVTALTGQVTVVVDGGRPIAAIVPATDLADAPAPASPGIAHSAPPPQTPRPPGVAHSSVPRSSPPQAPPSAPRQPADSVRPPGRSSVDRAPGAGHPPGGGHPPGAGHPLDGGSPLGGGHPSAAPVAVGKPSGESSAGWLRRIEKVREDVRRQHAGRIDELAGALEEAWQLLDAARPPGTDRHIDVARAAHADLRRSR
ncbi:hypothetical protein [Actinoplanes sp. NPDC051851]|uniref:hypothetical protein n=1 Tax=Actinoplanes sp. NPDC051851 TaxID=3154753 RepID=UPI003419CECE